MMEGAEGGGDNGAPSAGIRRRSVRLAWSEWSLLLVLAAVQFTHIVDFVLIMPLGPRLMSGLKLDHAQFGDIVSAYAFSASIAGLAAAFFLDRFDRKKALFFLYAGFVVGTGLCALAPNYLCLVLGRIVAGAFGGVGAATTLSIVGDVFPESRRGTAMGVLMSAFSIASIAGVPAGILLADLLVYWQAPFAALAGLATVVLLLIHLLLPPLRGHMTQERGNPGAAFVTILTQPSHLAAFGLTMALVMSTFTLAPSLPIYLVHNVGAQNEDLKYIYLFGGLATLLTLTPIGWLADRLGKRPVFRVLALLTIVPIVWTTNLEQLLAGAPRLQLLVLMFCCTSLFMTLSSGRMVPAMALVTATASPRDRGSFMSINSFFQQLGMGLAAWVGGRLIGETETKALTGYATVGWLCAGMSLLTVFLIGMLRPAKDGLKAVDVAVLPGDLGTPAPVPVVVEEGIRGVETTPLAPRPPLSDAFRDAAPLG
jgi:predicted MFS family arabinose efflux permease